LVIWYLNTQTRGSQYVPPPTCDRHDHIFRQRSLFAGTLAANWNDPGPLSGSPPTAPFSSALTSPERKFGFPILDHTSDSKLNKWSSFTSGTQVCIKSARHNRYSTLCPLGPLQPIIWEAISSRDASPSHSLLDSEAMYTSTMKDLHGDSRGKKVACCLW
jgi:hypothetical protein